MDYYDFTVTRHRGTVYIDCDALDVGVDLSNADQRVIAESEMGLRGSNPHRVRSINGIDCASLDKPAVLEILNKAIAEA